ncbi:DUF6894 family protein [Sphingomonas endolithica]|uniref:DUF6894 family protein n=1 Tax=Sphingomonas endolithica TaxID=2972485 RepID=UPI0021AF3FFE|nr:hypothetical protein [Sphingomonas sp. ZFBP2030]
MALYFFDTNDGDIFMEDDVGTEYSDLALVKVDAATTLAEIARDAVSKSVRRELSVAVRDELGPVLLTRMMFETIVLRNA